MTPQMAGEQRRDGEMDCRNLTGTDLTNPEKVAAYFDAGGLCGLRDVML
ncbi:MAG: hypothetical protein WA151_01840 [Desulfatirhabdiaceae bacterium]